MREKKVLIIDDDDMNLQIAKMVLEKKVKCTVICADNGPEGVAILRNEHIDLVLLDIMMPDFDGIDTLKEIRADEQLKDTSVMMLTAAGGIENLKKVYALGVKDYIKKPFMPADLISRVTKKLEESEPSEKILLIGTDTDELHTMQKLIEKIFNCETVIATSENDAKKFLRNYKITLVVASSDMKFIDGFKFLTFVSKEEKLAEVPFAITNSDNIIELIEKINTPANKDKSSENTMMMEELGESIVAHKDKNKLAKVVTSLVGYELDVHA